MGIDPNILPDRIKQQISDPANDAQNSSRSINKRDICREKEQTIFIHRLPPMLNDLMRMHWTQYCEVRDEWKLHIAALNPKRHTDKVSVEFIRHSTAEPDLDNAQAGFKVIGDAFVSLGIIEDDRASILTELKTQWKKCETRNQQGVEIIIKDIS
jgi:hypothetical protein